MGFEFEFLHPAGNLIVVLRIDSESADAKTGPLIILTNVQSLNPLVSVADHFRQEKTVVLLTINPPKWAAARLMFGTRSPKPGRKTDQCLIPCSPQTRAPPTRISPGSPSGGYGQDRDTHWDQGAPRPTSWASRHGGSKWYLLKTFSQNTSI